VGVAAVGGALYGERVDVNAVRTQGIEERGEVGA